MDSRNTFNRSFSQPFDHDPRPTAIPPPPYPRPLPPASSPPLLMSRPPTFYNNGVAVPRERERAEAARDMHIPVPQMSIGGPFGVATYLQSPSREIAGPSMTRFADRPPDTGGRWGAYNDANVEAHGAKQANVSSSLPPPPPPTTYGSPLKTFHVSEDPLRHATSQPRSPRMYGGSQSSLPPPPPVSQTLGGRQMLPPSSPQYNPSPSNRDYLQTSPHAAPREMLPTTMAPRPSSSMSISSMLGSDSSRPPRDPPPPSYPNHSTSSGGFLPLAHYQSSVGSPVRSGNNTMVEAQGSPPASSPLPGSTNRPFRAYSGGHTRSHKTSSASNGASNLGALLAESPSRRPGSLQPSTMDRPSDAHRHTNPPRVFDRPNSQPAPQKSHSMEHDGRIQETDSHRAEASRQDMDVGPSNLGSRQRVSTLDNAVRPSEFDRPPGQIRSPHSIEQMSPSYDLPRSAAFPFPNNASIFTESPTKPDPSQRLHRDTEREREAQPQFSKNPFEADALKRMREEHLGFGPPHSNREASQSVPNARPRPFDHLEGRSSHMETRQLLAAQSMDRSRSNDSSLLHRNSDDLMAHRHSLAAILDGNKRGRLSPLPQAVHGAQGRTDGPSRDPNIKNEFSRMFAGIGSGVSSTGLAGSGASTPFPQSPRQNAEGEQRLPRGSLREGTDSRSGSRMGRKRSSLKEDDSREHESSEKRATSLSLGSKNLKRMKHSHHHHPHGHHHHHHREEQTPLRTMNNVVAPATVPHHHHHHHHRHPDGTIHHHHHNRKPTPSGEKPPAAPRMPSVIINNDAILSTVQGLQRRHLGSVVYAPNVDPATSDESAKTKLGYATGQYSIPRCDGKENCTITVRVPRFYLTHDELLHVCARRAVWGTDIYTDDSDPLCAVVHAGWVRGAWPPEVDVKMLEPQLREVTLASDAVDWRDTVLEKPPAESPMIAPPNKDLHITLLILPALEAYAARVAHGVKSRAWGTDHDGLSFRVEKIAWVDEGECNAEERSAKIRKRRLERFMVGGRLGGRRGAAATATGFGKVTPSPPVKLTIGKLKPTRPAAKVAAAVGSA